MLPAKDRFQLFLSSATNLVKVGSMDTKQDNLLIPVYLYRDTLVPPNFLLTNARARKLYLGASHIQI